MQGQRRHQLHVVDTGLRRHVQHGLDHHLADIGRLHGRQRQRDVVEADGELHARTEKGRQGVPVALRMQQRVTYGAIGILDRLHGLGRVHDATAFRQRLEAEGLAAPEQGRWRRLVHLEDKAWAATHRIGPFRTSNAILTAPRRPAAPAWATASSKRVSGYVAETRRPVCCAAATSKARANVEMASSAPGPRSVPYAYAPARRTSRCHSGARSTVTLPGIPTSATVPRGRTMASDCAIDSGLPTQSKTMSAPLESVAVAPGAPP